MSDATPILTGLIGCHIAASRSPWMHEREARAHGLPLRYRLFDFAAARPTTTELEAQLRWCEDQGYAGVNVTHPFKQAIIPHLQSLSTSAARVGAVNTVIFAAGGRVGHNTDVTGFAASLREGLPRARLDEVLQLGAGGAGAATASALLESGAGIVWIHDRDAMRAGELVTRLHSAFGMERAAATDDPYERLAQVDGVVNATPVGMASDPGTPLDTGRLSTRHWVADVVYFPLETELLRDARRLGCAALDGSGMAIHQAAAAFTLFTGRVADFDRMRRSFLEFTSPAA